MKKLLVVMMALGFATSLKADIPGGRLYIEPEQIRVERDSICVNFQGTPFLVSGIHVDVQGLHVLSNEILDQHTFSNTCPLGHYSPGGSGMCNRDGCPFQKKK